jgi:two-component system chemotaxis sensor kinase CheA
VPSGTPPQRQSLVVVRQGGVYLGLVVDEILGSSPTVVRPLGALFRGVPGLSGSTIRRNGEVALILDVAGLLRQVPDGLHEAVA